MSARPKLLFVSRSYLLPPHTGGRIRTGQILRGLKGGAFHVTLASPAPAGAAERDEAELASMCDRFASWPEMGRRSSTFSYARYGLSRLPMSVATGASHAGRSLVARELGNRPDLVVVDFPHAAILLPRQDKTPSVLFTHNVEAEVLHRLVALGKDPIRRVVWGRQLRKLRRFEEETLRRFDTVISVSDRDALQFRRACGIEAAVIPTGVDLDFFAYRAPVRRDPEDCNLVFTASMDYYPNTDALHSFMDQCWPLVSAALPAARVTIIGRNPDPRLVRMAAARGLPWTFTGIVEDIRPHVYDSAACIIPLRAGGGTRIKVYEAMALGRPVISTSIGVEGLPVIPGQHFLLADTPEDFAKSVSMLQHDQELGARLAANARRLVETHCSMGHVAKVFESICLDTLERRTVRADRTSDRREFTKAHEISAFDGGV